MKPRHPILAALAVVLLLVGSSSCRDERSRLSASVGLPSELLLVVDPQVWGSDLSDSLTQLLKGEVPGLMQQEPFFRLTRVLSQHYTRSYSTMHSKLFVRIDPRLRRPMLGVSRNVVARPQIEVTLAAPSLDALRAYIYSKGMDARQLLADAQIEMRAARLRRHFSPQADAALREVLGYSICAPREIQATKKAERFLWAGSNRNEKDLNLVVYAYPWDGSDICTPETFVAKRDSVMQQHIPGSTDEQWMQTTRIDGRPVVFCSQRAIDGRRVQEVRGLWEMRRGALGGPFVSLVTIDTTAAQVVVAEGFVYSPSTDKRDLLRMVEASLRTLRKC
ncbi:MAG: DUF4837 family protein [Bacteroidaceae bacterium]|nr:DUF4837 family protein [Bacteroidaceae bacterium]